MHSVKSASPFQRFVASATEFIFKVVTASLLSEANTEGAAILKLDTLTEHFVVFVFIAKVVWPVFAVSRSIPKVRFLLRSVMSSERSVTMCCQVIGEV